MHRDRLGSRGEVVDEDIEEAMRKTAANQHTNDGQAAFFVAVNQVDLHVEGLTGRHVFAGRVEVELQQFVRRVFELDPVFLGG